MESDPNSQMLQEISQPAGEELPIGDANAPEEVVAAPEGEPVEEVAAEGSIIIDGKTFANESEAYEHTKKLLAESDTEKLIMAAKQEAYQEAMHLNQQAQAPVIEEAPEVDDSDEFYADPQGYFKKKSDAIEDRIRTKIQGEMAATNADVQLWQEFFAAHPDLDGFKDDCQQMLNANLDTVKLLASKDRRKAMDFLATKTREKFQTYADRMKPRKELHRTNDVPSVGTNHVASVTQQEKDGTPLDFVSQMRNLKR